MVKSAMLRRAPLIVTVLALVAAAWALWPRRGHAPRRPQDSAPEIAAGAAEPPPRLAPAARETLPPPPAMDGSAATPAGDPESPEPAPVVDGARVSGRVVAARTGAPVVGASVDVRDGGEVDGTTGIGIVESYGPVVSDAEGRFETPVLPYGQIVTVAVRARGFAWAEVPMLVQPVAGTRATMDVRLEPGGVLRGVVVDPDGEPVPAATAFAFPEAWREVRWDPLVRSGNEEARRVETDAAGRFEVEGLPLGVPLCATARGEPFARALDACGVTLSETAGEANVTLRLRRPASVEVTLRDPEGAPVTRGAVTVGAALTERRGVLDARGRARIEGLSPGATVLDVDLDGFVPVHEEIVLVEGQTLARLVSLSRGLAIDGILVDESGAPIAGASVQASREGARRYPVAGTRTHDDGTFRIEGLEPGAHRLTAYGTGIDVPRSEPMTVPATGIRLVATHLGEVRARLLAPAGRAPKGLTVGAYQEDGGSASSEGWNDGRVSWKVPRGRWRLTVRAPGFAPVERSVDVASAGPLDLGEIVLDEGASVEGVVVGRDGVALTGVRVGGTDLDDDAQAQSGTDGRFRLDHLRRARVTLAVSLPSHLPATVPCDLSGPVEPLRIVLSRGALLTAKLRLPGGGRPQATLHWRATQRGEAQGASTIESSYFGEDDGFAVRLPAGRFALEILDGETVVWRQELTLEEGKDVAMEIPLRGR